MDTELWIFLEQEFARVCFEFDAVRKDQTIDSFERIVRCESILGKQDMINRVREFLLEKQPA